jgi:hypothetical protein
LLIVIDHNSFENFCQIQHDHNNCNKKTRHLMKFQILYCSIFKFFSFFFYSNGLFPIIKSDVSIERYERLDNTNQNISYHFRVYHMCNLFPKFKNNKNFTQTKKVDFRWKDDPAKKKKKKRIKIKFSMRWKNETVLIFFCLEVRFFPTIPIFLVFDKISI